MSKFIRYIMIALIVGGLILAVLPGLILTSLDFFISINYYSSERVKRDADNILAAYQNKPIKDNGDFVKRYADVMLHLVPAQDVIYRIDSQLHAERIEEILGQPTVAFYEPDIFDREYSRREYQYVYEKASYDAIINFDNIRSSDPIKAILQREEGNYYDSDQLDRLFFETVENINQSKMERRGWFNEMPPSALRLISVERPYVTRDLLFFPQAVEERANLLQVQSYDHAGKFFRDFPRIGKVQKRGLEINRFKEIEVIEIPEDLFTEIESMEPQEFDLTQFGTSLAEIIALLGAEPQIYRYNNDQPDQLEAMWQIQGGDLPIYISVRLDISQVASLDEKQLKDLPIEKSYRYGSGFAFANHPFPIFWERANEGDLMKIQGSRYNHR